MTVNDSCILALRNQQMWTSCQYLLPGPPRERQPNDPPAGQPTTTSHARWLADSLTGLYTAHWEQHLTNVSHLRPPVRQK